MMRIEEESKKRCAGAAGAKFCAQSCSSYFSRSFARALSFRSGVRFVINMSTASLQSMSVVVGQGLSREWAGGTWSLGGRGEGRTEEIREKEERVANRRAMCLRPACHPPSLSRETRLELPDQMRRAGQPHEIRQLLLSQCSLPKTTLSTGNRPLRTPAQFP